MQRMQRNRKELKHNMIYCEVVYTGWFQFFGGGDEYQKDLEKMLFRKDSEGYLKDSIKLSQKEIIDYLISKGFTIKDSKDNFYLLELIN